MSSMNNFENLNNTADYTNTFDPADIQQNKLMGVLAYLSWLVLIPIFAAPKSKFARFHANQGLILAIVHTAWIILSTILEFILTIINWYVGWIFGIIFTLLGLVFIVPLILGIINASNGRAKELPLIGKIRILK